jgi:hypothetical protein
MSDADKNSETEKNELRVVENCIKKSFELDNLKKNFAAFFLIEIHERIY